MRKESGIISTVASAGPQHTWSVVSVLCLVVALVLLWLAQLEAAFVAGTLGVVAWFLNFRGQLESKNVEADAARAARDDENLFVDEDEDDGNEV